MRGDCYPLMKRSFGFENDMASHLMHNLVLPIPAKGTNQVGSA